MLSTWKCFESRGTFFECEYFRTRGFKYVKIDLQEETM